jgi:glycosyl transferase family 2
VQDVATITQATASRCPLSVIVATTQPWPEVRGCLESLYRQAEDLGAEIILSDGSGEGLTKEAALKYPNVQWLKSPGSSVFYLRALAMSYAKSQILAMTEDHCKVAHDWCRRVIQAHEEYPQAAAIGGAVENGATRTLADWASFFIVNGASMSPLKNGESSKIAAQANVSYKRRVIPNEIPSNGRMEWMFTQSLRQRGEKLVADDRISVHHIQSLGFANTCRIHFDDGRTIAAFRLPDITWLERGIRLLACPIMPAAHFVRAAVPVLTKHRLYGRFLASSPMIALLLICRAAGAVCGFAADAGNSPVRIR